jgi:hypothetical protein
MHQGVTYALLAAALFGASAPLAKELLGEIHPIVLAALLYAGSGAGLAIVQILRVFVIERTQPDSCRGSLRARSAKRLEPVRRVTSSANAQRSRGGSSITTI